MVENKHNLDSNLITGFTDAEGCFMISIYKYKIYDEIKWRVQASFKIELYRDLDLLLQIKSFLIR